MCKVFISDTNTIDCKIANEKIYSNNESVFIRGTIFSDQQIIPYNSYTLVKKDGSRWNIFIEDMELDKSNIYAHHFKGNRIS